MRISRPRTAAIGYSVSCVVFEVRPYRRDKVISLDPAARRWQLSAVRARRARRRYASHARAYLLSRRPPLPLGSACRFPFAISLYTRRLTHLTIYAITETGYTSMNSITVYIHSDQGRPRSPKRRPPAKQHVALLREKGNMTRRRRHVGGMPTISRALEAEKRRAHPPRSYTRKVLHALLNAPVVHHLRLQVARHVGVLAAKLLRG